MARSPEVIEYVPAGSLKSGAKTVTMAAALGAFFALVLHHKMQPHGEVIRAEVGTTITMTRTVGRWHVTDSTGRSYFTDKVRVDAVHNN